jgi:hypothetical protein
VGSKKGENERRGRIKGKLRMKCMQIGRKQETIASEVKIGREEKRSF